MLSNFFTLIKIGRALAKSNSLSIFEEFYKPPLSIKVLIKIFGFTTFNKDSANFQSMPPHLPDFEEVLSEFFYVLLFSHSLLTLFPRMLSVAKLKCCPKTFQSRMRGCSFSDCFGPQPLSC